MPRRAQTMLCDLICVYPSLARHNNDERVLAFNIHHHHLITAWSSSLLRTCVWINDSISIIPKHARSRHWKWLGSRLFRGDTCSRRIYARNVLSAHKQQKFINISRIFLLDFRSVIFFCFAGCCCWVLFGPRNPFNWIVKCSNGKIHIMATAAAATASAMG